MSAWEPELPPDDTLVRQAVLVHASWVVELARGTGRPWRTGPRWVGAWGGDRAAMSNQVILVQPLTDPAPVIGEVNSLIPAHVPYVLSSPWPTPDLREHGLVLLGHFPLMVRFPGPRSERSEHSVDVREVQDTWGLVLAERIFVEGFPVPELEPLTAGELLGPSTLECPIRVWLAWLDGEPVAVAAAHSAVGVQLVFYVATLRAARRRGAGAAVSWAATLAEPDRPAVLVASDDGRPVYERMGYVAIERWSVWRREH